MIKLLAGVPGHSQHQLNQYPDSRIDALALTLGPSFRVTRSHPTGQSKEPSPLPKSARPLGQTRPCLVQTLRLLKYRDQYPATSKRRVLRGVCL